MSTEREFGILKFFNEDEDYGFIKLADGGKDVFVHRERFVDGVPDEGIAVSFIRKTSRKSGKAYADDVRVMTEEQLIIVLKGEGILKSKQASGTLKFFNEGKGYGFIISDDGGRDVFLHITALQGSGLPIPAEGDGMVFDIEDDPRGRGKKAVNISLT